MLRICSLNKRYGSVSAVNGVSVDIPDGQMVGIIGRSGAGKSTLLRLINRLIDPSDGSIDLDGVDVTGLKGRALRDWRARSAMIFQQFNLVNRLDVLTNVLVGRVSYNGTLPTLIKRFPVDDRARAVKALDRLDMLPQAFQRADTLSGGQQQRVAIARALVQEPKLILADEPIASLDPANAKRVMNALKDINQSDGITVLCNLHALDVATEFCDRIIGLSKGRIVFDGTPAGLGSREIEEIYGTARPDAADDLTLGAAPIAAVG